MAATTTPSATRRDSTRPRSAARPRGTARRDALVQATLTLVGEVGADAVTHRRVAEAAGLPLASTTYWFESKEHLLTAALQFASERDLARLRATADALGARPTVTEIVDVVAGDGDGGQCSDRGSLLATYTLMLEAARRPALQAISERWTDGYLETIGELLHRAGSQRPQADARLLIAATDGLLIDRLAAGAEHDFDPRPDLEHLLDALLPGGEGSR
jgi:TetR/AcrR family transcriptional regulator, regulator of biofilm formation and stress response